LLYIRSLLQDTCRIINSVHELIGAELNGLNLRLSIYLVYRPAHQTVDNDTELYTLLSRLIQNKIAVIAGDFNCNINWENRTSGMEGNRLVDFANDNFLTQVVDEPTRGNNSLDLIFTSEDDLISIVIVGEYFGTSDHCVVKCKLGV
jgi:endonuclease/exonuclease/phosphatase family metal-dependent hydrolase